MHNEQQSLNSFACCVVLLVLNYLLLFLIFFHTNLEPCNACICLQNNLVSKSFVSRLIVPPVSDNINDGAIISHIIPASSPEWYLTKNGYVAPWSKVLNLSAADLPSCVVCMRLDLKCLRGFAIGVAFSVCSLASTFARYFWPAYQHVHTLPTRTAEHLLQ